MLILIIMLSGCIQGINESVQQIQEQENALIPQANERVVSGEQLFIDKGCFACHEYNTLTCPELEGLSERGTFLDGKEKVSAENLARWLRNPGAMKPGTTMPNLNLKEEEINKLVEYLLSK